MKTKEEIEKYAENLWIEKELLKNEYSHLHQIDMLSETGVVIQAKINKIDGQLKALDWVQK